MRLLSAGGELRGAGEWLRRSNAVPALPVQCALSWGVVATTTEPPTEAVLSFMGLLSGCPASPPKGRMDFYEFVMVVLAFAQIYEILRKKRDDDQRDD